MTGNVCHDIWDSTAPQRTPEIPSRRVFTRSDGGLSWPDCACGAAAAQVWGTRQGQQQWISGSCILSPRSSTPATSRQSVDPATRLSHRHHPGCGDTAALSARGHALAQPDGHSESGQRRNPAPLPEALGREGSAGKSTCPAVGMLRGHPDLILDTCSVRAKRGGDLPAPTRPTAAREAPSTTSRPMGTACRSPASPQRPT